MPHYPHNCPAENEFNLHETSPKYVVFKLIKTANKHLQVVFQHRSKNELTHNITFTNHVSNLSCNK